MNEWDDIEYGWSGHLSKNDFYYYTLIFLLVYIEYGGQFFEVIHSLMQYELLRNDGVLRLHPFLQKSRAFLVLTERIAIP
ncbi:MAG: hypothetical protein U5K69_08955 [Balneolaceae bacterium]|nr:hypothetical protein [Balneolaceae bacterium]